MAFERYLNNVLCPKAFIPVFILSTLSFCNMSKYKLLLLCLLIVSISVYGQTGLTIKGTITDENRHPLMGATIILMPSQIGTTTNLDGFFEIGSLRKQAYVLEISFLGYETLRDTLSVGEDCIYNATLKESLVRLNEITVIDKYAEWRKKKETLNMEIVDGNFLKQNIGGSLMKSLERLPGVTSMDIGSGQSKPVIRGLGFNRVVVVENGIKHEAQQWGSDHGLEIDQYAIDNVEVIKGPASLMYGSDAIGGVIAMKNRHVPDENTFGGTIDFTGKTNNDFVGGSASFYFRKEKFFADFRATILDYGDYKVPTNYVDIYSYRAPLYKHHLRNTAGKEQDFHTSFGYIDRNFQSRFFISNVYSKSGFFANAHGQEPLNVDTELHDHSSRDIQQPYQSVNHFKINNESRFRFGKSTVTLDLGFQQNFRQEKSMYTSHGYMPAVCPDTLGFLPNLEREFDKQVYSANVSYGLQLNERTELKFGSDIEFQKNEIDGRGFIIPAYRQLKPGAFVFGKQQISEHGSVQLGARYDYGHIHTNSYNDWFPTPVITSGTTMQYLQRTAEFDRSFSCFTWFVGYSFETDHGSIKVNVGKSFRMPIAKELAANGVNYHNYSYEVGNADLSSEESYQFDLGAEFNTKNFAIGITPFVNYFPNYIYLNPTAEHDRLYGSGNQVFYYMQSRVFRTGGELHAHYEPIRNLRFGVVAEYVYSEQLSGEKKGYTLPFSHPTSVLFNVKYSRSQMLFLGNVYLSFDCRMVASQTHIVPPEEPTDGYQTFGISTGGDILIGRQKLILTMQVQNLFDATYFNHTSFYRLINVPESGRNFIVNLTFPFSGNIKQK